MTGARLLSCVLALLLAACTSPPPLPTGGFRDRSVPLSVTTRGAAADLIGQWHVRSHFWGDGNIETLTFVENWQGAPAVEFFQTGCPASGDCDGMRDIWRSQALGQNRFRLTSDNATGAIELWVIWIDEGFRTAALGTPDGSFGWIVDRAQTGGEDRIIAAREILEFNGYDTTKMVRK